MATSTPFVHVTINQYGFSVLDTRINLVNTDAPKAIALMMIMATAGIRSDDADGVEWMEWIEEQYTKELEAQSTCSVPSSYVLKPFHVNDYLVSIRHEVVYDNY
jgi:hypothetical protein